jgi:serine protein kinase
VDVLARLDIEKIKTVGDYLESSWEQPILARNTHHFISDMIDYYGKERVFEGLYGLDEQIDNMVLFFHAHNTSLERRLLLFVGPQGAGKSYTVDKIKKNLEAFSQVPEGVLFAVKDCPFHQHPYDLISHEERPALKEKHHFRWYPEAIPCPVCEQKIRKLKDWRAVPVERIGISSARKTGLAKHTPTDLRREDITNFVGNINFSKLKKIGSTYDPDSFDFEGKIIWANRGILDWTEIFKSRRQLLGLLLELIQSKRIDMTNFPTVHVDEIVIGHTNFPEYNVFVNEDIMEPLRGRIFKIEFPYGLSIENEKKIYRQFTRRTDNLTQQKKHISDDTLTFLSTYAVRTRKDSKGLQGLSPRFFQDVLSMAYTRSESCIDMEIVSESVMKMFDHKTEKDLHVVKELFEKTKEEFIQSRIKMFINRVVPKNYADYGQNIYQNYLTAVKRKLTGGEVAKRDSELVDEVEDLLVAKEKISPKGKAAFESVLIERFDEMLKMPYTANDQLAEPINEVVFNRIKNFLRLSNKTKKIDPQSREVRQILEDTLVREYDYCKHCAGVLFKILGEQI